MQVDSSGSKQVLSTDTNHQLQTCFCFALKSAICISVLMLRRLLGARAQAA